jgi:hypothetical protein
LLPQGAADAGALDSPTMAAKSTAKLRYLFVMEILPRPPVLGLSRQAVPLWHC